MTCDAMNVTYGNLAVIAVDKNRYTPPCGLYSSEHHVLVDMNLKPLLNPTERQERQAGGLKLAKLICNSINHQEVCIPRTRALEYA
jgi:hypothetical protein